MKLLIVAATTSEVKPFQEKIGWNQLNQTHRFNNHDLDVLITGVGMVATAFSLGKHLSSNQYDLAINIGLAGSFDKNLELGEVVEVELDQFSELGAEDGNTFLSLDELGLQEKDDSLFKEGKLHGSKLDTDLSIKKVEGITVNAVHGNDSTIQQLKNRINPTIESMEGAAFFYSCLKMNMKCIQLRSISNYVEKRNKQAWEIELALNNLAEKMVYIINQL